MKLSRKTAASPQLRVAVLGATGYTGVELLRLLLRHPRLRVDVVTSQQFVGRPLREVYPSLAGKCDLVLQDIDVKKIAAAADFAFAALPHDTSMDVVARLVEARIKVVDLSPDFRLRDPGVYRKWYREHKAPSLLGETVYGLTEIHREAVAGAKLVANPGCYPTGVVLGLAPLFAAKIVRGDVVVDAKSGVTGAGKSASVELSFSEVNENFKAYNVGAHRHTPEMEQELSEIAGDPVRVLFAPHLVPMSRGILSTMYVELKKSQTDGDLIKRYRDYYAGDEFVHILPAGQFPQTRDVRGSNDCTIGLRYDARMKRLVVITAIDNLVKGAAGQAVQNMNLMCGWPEGEGLAGAALVP